MLGKSPGVVVASIYHRSVAPFLSQILSREYRTCSTEQQCCTVCALCAHPLSASIYLHWIFIDLALYNEDLDRFKRYSRKKEYICFWLVFFKGRMGFHYSVCLEFFSSKK
jgi:hypothetical protein